MKTILNNITTKAAIFALLTISIAITSCVTGTGASLNKEDFADIQEELQEKFGKNAYYTDFTVTYNSAVGNIIGVTVTEDPSSLKMGQWNYMQGTWKQNSDITVEIPEGTQAADYMFQLGETVNLSQLGKLVAQSMETLKSDHDIPDPALSIAGLNYPDNGDVSKAQYLINLVPEKGGTTYSFFYKLNGELVKMDY